MASPYANPEALILIAALVECCGSATKAHMMGRDAAMRSYARSIRDLSQRLVEAADRGALPPDEEDAAALRELQHMVLGDMD